MCPSGATCLPADCCFSELTIYKSYSACWSWTKRTSSSSHWQSNVLGASKLKGINRIDKSANVTYAWGWSRVWKYQRGNQNLYIEEKLTTQWPKVQSDKQRYTKHTHRTKDRVTRTPLKTGGELRCSERVSSSCSTSDTRHVNLVTNPVISNEWGKNREMLTTRGTYSWSFFDTYFP